MQKGQGSHHMLLEIHEEPVALRDTLTGVADACKKIALELVKGGLGMIYFSGSGTSYHAALASHYLMSSLTSIPTNSIPASEYDAWVRAPSTSKNVLIAISQSGESVDVLSAIKTAKRRGTRTVAVTNVPSSSLVKSADFCLVTRARPEKAVTATKTFVSCLAASYLLSLELVEASHHSAFVHERVSALRQELVNSPQVIEDTIMVCEDRAKTIAESLRQHSLFFLLGRGANYATALEGALKLKESSNVMAEGYAAREFLHGPMQLVNENTPVIAITTSGDHDLVDPLSERFERLGAPILRISDPSVAANHEQQLSVARSVPESLSPLVFIAPIQLFAYYSAISRGLDPDKPTKLTKVVK